MDFSFTEPQLEVQRIAREYAKKRLRPTSKTYDKQEHFPAEEIKEMAKLGLMGINVSPKYGGLGAGSVSFALAIFEIAKANASVAVTMSVTNMVAETIEKFGTEPQKEKYIRAICSGDYPAGAFALSEPGAGSDPAGLRTRAIQEGNHWIINGEKLWITSGTVAGIAIVVARTDPGGKTLSAFLVEKEVPGYNIGRKEHKLGQKGSETVAISLEDCRVPNSAILDSIGAGFKIGMTALDGGRVSVAALSCGIAKEALSAATSYAKKNKRLGGALKKSQPIQWKLADMATELEAAFWMTIKAAYLKESQKPFTQEASMAKVFSSETAGKICELALQIAGLRGYTDNTPIERLLRDARVTRIYEGTSEIQRVVISRNLIRHFAP